MSWSGGSYGGLPGSKFDNDPAYSGGQAAPSPQQQPYGQPGYGAAGGSKFDPDPTYGGASGASAYNPAPSYGPTPTYGGVNVGSGGGGGSKFDAEPAVRVGSSGLVSKFDNDPSFSVPTVSYSGPTQYDSGSQWSASAQDCISPQYGGGPPTLQQPAPCQQQPPGGPPFQGPPHQQQQQHFQQPPQYGGPQNGGPHFGAPPPGPYGGMPPQGGPPPGHAPSYASQPNQPLPQGPGPHPVRPWAGGLQQPAGPGPQGQGTLSGRKRAVLVGCNYAGSSAQLKGCINDTKCIRYLLQSKFGFKDGDIRMLVDDHPNPACWPTRHNICLNIAWLLGDQRPGDDLFFHYSGHGSQQRDTTGEETSGFNDTILPCDFKRAGQIDDNELCQRLVNPLQHGVRLHAVIDACHSGSALDLPFRCKVKGGVPTWKSEYVEGRQRSHKGTAGGLAIQIAAAGDRETAADTNALSGGTSTGAATFAFIQAIEQHGTRITYGTLLLQMDQVLHSIGGNSGVGGMVNSLGLGKLLGGSSGGSKLMGMMEGGLSAAGMRGGQTPQISANYAFDMNTSLQM